MRNRRNCCALLGAAAALCVAGIAGAATPIQPISGVNWISSGGPVLQAPVVGSTVSVYTGVATAANQLVLIEPTAPPVRDDVVAFDLVSEQINDYSAAAGGIQRFVNENDVDNGNGTRTLTVTVTGQTAAGGPGDLWPSGLTSGTTALTSGGFGIGLNLPDVLDNSPTGDVFDFLGSSIINSSTVAISTSGTFAAPLALPSTFYDPNSLGYPVPGSAWNGIVGISFGNGATGTGIQDGIRLSITYTPVPEPTSAALLALCAGGLIRRRRA